MECFKKGTWIRKGFYIGRNYFN